VGGSKMEYVEYLKTISILLVSVYLGLKQRHGNHGKYFGFYESR
jgi:hypothetical protein